jgi:hypothetical protein
MKYLPASFELPAICGEDEEIWQGKPHRLTFPTFRWERPRNANILSFTWLHLFPSETKYQYFHIIDVYLISHMQHLFVYFFLHNLRY